MAYKNTLCACSSNFPFRLLLQFKFSPDFLSLKLAFYKDAHYGKIYRTIVLLKWYINSLLFIKEIHLTSTEYLAAPCNIILLTSVYIRIKESRSRATEYSVVFCLLCVCLWSTLTS